MARGDGTARDDCRMVWSDEYGDYIEKEPISVGYVIPFIVIVGFIVTFILWVNNTDKTYDSPTDTQWNGGICAACGTPWHYLDSVGTVNSTRYIYECECGNHRMESYTLR